MRRLLIAFLLLAGTAQAQPVPGSGRLDYVISRDGDQIGTHVITFQRTGDQLHVDTRVEIAVQIAFITVYRFTKTTRETWRNGRVVGYRAETDDNGALIKASVGAGPEGLIAIGPRGRIIATPDTMISGYWNIATVKQKALLDSEDVRLIPIAVENLGETELRAGVKARHYRITGELARELWYGANGLLLKMRATASDGSVIDTVSRQLLAAGDRNTGK